MRVTPRILALAALALGLATILGAWGFEIFGGFVPCELCYQQRLPYYIGLPILALTQLFWPRLQGLPRLALTLLVALIFAWGAYLGAFHAGVEWGFWPGPTSCTGVGGGIGFEDLGNMDATRIVPCDRPQIRIFGLSFAGWNAKISVLIVGLLGWAALKMRRA
ncbi:MAG: disulfide bond formation protein B [Cucumibacter sp.]